MDSEGKQQKEQRRRKKAAHRTAEHIYVEAKGHGILNHFVP